jgi:hypothetical protein
MQLYSETIKVQPIYKCNPSKTALMNTFNFYNSSAAVVIGLLSAAILRANQGVKLLTNNSTAKPAKRKQKERLDRYTEKNC